MHAGTDSPSLSQSHRFPKMCHSENPPNLRTLNTMHRPTPDVLRDQPYFPRGTTQSATLSDATPLLKQRMHQNRWRPYRVECTGSLLTSEVKRHRARLVLGWGTAWELPGVLPAFATAFVTAACLPEGQTLTSVFSSESAIV